MPTRVRRKFMPAVLLAGALCAVTGCTAAAPGAVPGAVRQSPAVHAGADHGVSVAAVSTTSTLPQCGFQRDPLDPTNTPAPAGLCP